MTEFQVEAMRELIRETLQGDRNAPIMLAGYLSAVLDGMMEEEVGEETIEGDTTVAVREPGDPGEFRNVPASEVSISQIDVTVSSNPPEEGRGKNTCGYCSVKGHSAKTCPKKRMDERAPEEESEKSGEDDEPEVLPLTEEEFDYLKKAAAEGTSSSEVAREMSLSLAEVNKAWAQIDYDHYIEYR